MEELHIQEESKVFLKLTLVIDIDFLDKDLVHNCLEACYCPENGVDQTYIEWDTNWNFSVKAKQLSDHLVLKGIPKGKPVLIKL